MKQIENLKATGQLFIKVLDADGVLKNEVLVDNLVVDTGLGFIASRMAGATAAAMSHMGIGSGSSPAVSGNTALGSQLARVALTSTTVNANQITYSATFSPAAGTGALTEAAIFNAATSGTMLCRTVFPVVNKEAGDTMVINWVVTIGAA